MCSGAIASFDSRSDSGPELSPGLGFPTATAQSAERTEPVGFFPLLRDGGLRGLGLGADCRCRWLRSCRPMDVRHCVGGGLGEVEVGPGVAEPTAGLSLSPASCIAHSRHFWPSMVELGTTEADKEFGALPREPGLRFHVEERRVKLALQGTFFVV